MMASATSSTRTKGNGLATTVPADDMLLVVKKPKPAMERRGTGDRPPGPAAGSPIGSLHGANNSSARSGYHLAARIQISRLGVGDRAGVAGPVMVSAGITQIEPGRSRPA